MTRAQTAIISTSINPSPHAYQVWAERGDLIVAGDRNTPDELVEFVADVGGRYLIPEEQMAWKSSAAIGWNCIQRRNMAALIAYAAGYDYILTVDDDNIPTCTSFVEDHIRAIQENAPDANRIAGDDWINTGDFVIPPTRQRGTPFGVDTSYHYRAGYDAWAGPRSFVAVSQAQILDSPDCDAVTRIAHNPVVEAVEQSVVIESGWFAFNSQATLWDGEFAPLLACLPGVGRYDDIFASLIAQAILRTRGQYVHVGAPAARQHRNDHDPAVDLRKELYGMDKIFRVVEALKALHDRDFVRDRGHIMNMYRLVATCLQNVLPHETIMFMLTWVSDWEKAYRLRQAVKEEKK